MDNELEESVVWDVSWQIGFGYYVDFVECKVDNIEQDDLQDT